jgi:hypothetical protein
MTAQSSNQSRSIPHDPVTREAALIANFYGKRGKLQPIIDHLVRSFVLIPQEPDSYVNKESGTLLHHFDPGAVSAQDTTIIQLALNAPGSAEVAWKAMREQLAATLPNDNLLAEVWGYTLIYQAELVRDIASHDILPALLPAVQRLNPHKPLPDLICRAANSG